jgi:hypothetical protein
MPCGKSTAESERSGGGILPRFGPAALAVASVLFGCEERPDAN